MEAGPETRCNAVRLENRTAFDFLGSNRRRREMATVRNSRTTEWDEEIPEPTGNATGAGAVIGGILGLVGGPAGALIGAGIGAAIGASVDADERKEYEKKLRGE